MIRSRLGWHCLAAVLVPGLATAPAQAQATLDATTFGKLDAYVSRQLVEARIPGAAVAVVQGGRIVHARGYGTAGDRDMTAKTPVLIASLTKGMTAIAIMQLVEEGRIDLDAPVSRYLPSFRVADPAASALITVRHLLSHSSGLPTSAQRAFLRNPDSSRQALANGVTPLARIRPVARPGEEFHYSNPNYTLLGAIVEAVSGKPYEAYMQQHVFDRIGMSSTFTSLPEARAHGLATGFQYMFGLPVRAAQQPHDRRWTPAGLGVAASAEDMGRYLNMLLRRGATGGERVLAEGSVDALFHPQIKVDRGAGGAYADLPMTGGQASYGLGWNRSTIHGRDAVWHTGSWPYATNTYALMVPGEDWGFVVLVNAFTAGPGPKREELAYGIRDVLMRREPAPVRLLGWPLPLILLAGLLILQLLGIAHAVRLVRRWRGRPELRPASRTMRLGWHTTLPLLGLLCIVFIHFFLATRPGGTALWGIRRVPPDQLLLMTVSAGLALGWAMVRTMLVVRVLGRGPATAVGAT